MEEEEVFDLATINDYELLSNEDGTVLIQDNSVVIKHKESEELKMLPLTDDILQALGLALVLDEDENKKDTTEMTMKHEVVEAILPDHILENAEMVLDQPQEMHEERLEESQDEDADSQHNKETITIVFTDDEDPALSKPTAEIRNNEEFMDIEDSDKEYEESAGHGNKPTLVWSQEMVSTLLDMYEQNQSRFSNRGRSHRSLWVDIHAKMCLKYPELRQWSEYCLQNKFHRLKKSYKGALMYWKNNYHKSRWVHFEKMHKLMTRQAEIDGTSKSKYKYPLQYESKNRTPNAVKMAPIERRATPEGCVGTFLWRKRWTPLMLDMFERLGGGKEPSFWVKLRETMMLSEPEVKTVSAAQLQAKMFNLKRAYKFFKQRPMLEPKGDLADKSFFERIARICDSESTEQPTQRMRPLYEHKSRSERIYSGPTDRLPKKTTQQKNYVSRFLDLYKDNCSRFKYSEHPMEIFDEISDLMQRELGDQVHVTPEKLFFKFIDVKNKYEAVIADGSQEAKDSWPLFSKVESLLQPKPELWCPRNTHLLLDLYGKVKNTLDASGPKFWNELTEKFKQIRPGTSVNATKCENRMNLLLEKFNHLNEHLPIEDAKKWIYYEKLEQITTPECEPWPDSDVEILLSVYQKNLSRFESEEKDNIWEDVSERVSEQVQRQVSALNCKRVMMGLKEKYAKLMKDSVAGASWPFYKSMSEIFPSTLWSKSNVSILLDAYSKHHYRLESEDPQSVWQDIQREVNENSTTAVSHTQCQNEMHVLKARYGAINNSKTGTTSNWPFYDKLHKILSAGLHNNSVNVTVQRQNEYEYNNENSQSYEWTDDRINHLLDLYLEKRSDQDIPSRRDLFSSIDRDLSLSELVYEIGIIGCNAWQKYSELANKYIEVKEGRNDDADWVFYQKMDSILGRRRKRSISTASNDSHDSIADKLHELLDTPSKKIKYGDNGEMHITDENSQDDWNILTAGHTADKVTIKSEPVNWEDNETLLLIDIYDAHKRRFEGNANHNHIWADIHRQIRNKVPSFKKTPQHCEDRINWLKMTFQKAKHGVKIPPGQRLHHTIYKKMDSIFSDSKSWHRSSNGSLHNPDVQQHILDEVKKRNHLQSMRNDILKEYCEEKLRLEKEKVEILKRVEERLSQTGEEIDGATRQKLLETLQGVVNENDASL